jgi:hypothetical protein
VHLLHALDLPAVNLWVRLKLDLECAGLWPEASGPAAPQNEPWLISFP